MKASTKVQLGKIIAKVRKEGFIKTRERRIPGEKIKALEEIATLLRKYRTIGICDLTKTPAKQLHTIRKLLRDRDMVIKVFKNRIFEHALNKADIPNREEVKKLLIGSNLFIFTNMNAFELKLLLDKVKVPKKAKPGDVAEKEIVISSGDTGLPTGPIMSVFGKLKIPIQVREGRIWVTRDTVVAKPGDKISSELASLLDKLGIEPFEFKLRLKAVYDSGLIIPGEKLVVDVDAIQNDVLKAIQQALSVAVEVALPEKQVLELSLSRAYRRAIVMAAELGFVTKEIVTEVLQIALTKAQLLASLIAPKAPELGIELAAPKPATEEAKEEKKEKKEEEEEKKEITEEELGEGLAALFG